MAAHKIFYETWEIAASVAQSSHDEVCTFLCLFAQIDSFSTYQLREFGIRKGLKKLVISSKIRIFIGENQ